MYTLRIIDQTKVGAEENFYQYIGTWKTNQIIWSDDYGSDEENKSRKERRSNIYLESSINTITFTKNN